MALPILLPFVLVVLAFSGDAGGVDGYVIFFLAALTTGFLVATYALLTVIDWIGKHV